MKDGQMDLGHERSALLSRETLQQSKGGGESETHYTRIAAFVPFLRGGKVGVFLVKISAI